MPISTTIHQFNTDDPYRMEIIYDRTDNSWYLRFTCLVPYSYKEEIRKCSSFSDAVRRFNSNCRYYHVPEITPCTEEEFLGVPTGTIFPAAKLTNHKQDNHKEAIC